MTARPSGKWAVVFRLVPFLTLTAISLCLILASRWLPV